MEGAIGVLVLLAIFIFFYMKWSAEKADNRRTMNELEARRSAETSANDRARRKRLLSGELSKLSIQEFDTVHEHARQIGWTTPYTVLSPEMQTLHNSFVVIGRRLVNGIPENAVYSDSDWLRTWDDVADEHTRQWCSEKGITF